VNVFVSPVNGDALFLAERLPIGTTSTTLYVPPEQGGRCMTLHMAPMPAGHIVRQHQGKLLVARGAAVFTSQPYAYGIYDPAEDFMQFPAEVTLLEPVGAGLFIVADKTYFLPNGSGAAIAEVLPYGAPRGAAVQRGEGGGIYWMGDRGLVQATDDGQAKNVNDGVLTLPKPHSAALHGCAAWCPIRQHLRNGRTRPVGQEIRLVGHDEQASAYRLQQRHLSRKLHKVLRRVVDAVGVGLAGEHRRAACHQ
jgi:hypothetical protein